MDVKYIQDIIQSVVDSKFSSQIMRRINIYTDRINFRCCYCLEGRTKTKKRANIYTNRLLYICFRCGKSTTFDKFCKDFNIQIDPSKKLEMIEHLDRVITYNDYQSDAIEAKFENLIDLSDLEHSITMNLTPLTEFKPIQENGGIYKYLCNRGISAEYHKNIYQAKYWKNEDEHEWVIVMLNRKGDKILGMQIRNLKEGKRRTFKIYNYENILEWVNLGKEEPKFVDINEMVIYNKLSYFFNILNIDFGNKITIFEGYLDSLFYPNSIGMVGVNTDDRFLENNGLDIQYFYDNDEAGFKKSEQKIKSGISVFLWNKLFNYIVDKKRVEDPYKLLDRISKVKDLNKLSQIMPDAYKKLNLEEHFSKDIMDMKWIPKYKKYKKIEEIDYNKKFDVLDKL